MFFSYKFQPKLNMSFLHKNFRHKPSLVKPVAVVATILLVIGGLYTFFGDKSKDVAQNDSANQAAINSSGLDQDEKVTNIADVEKVIAKWIEANPQAIIASVTNMQKKVAEEQMKNAQKNISDKKNELFDKSSPNYSPSGYNVTIVEFFDYSCGYCKKAQTTIQELVDSDKKIRIIYKEFPILGQASEEMANVAIAVNMIDPSSYKKFHDALMKSNERGKDGAMKIAQEVGINISKLESILKNNKDKIAKIIEANRTLGTSIGINGTPGFVIGEELVPGALELQAFKDKVAAVRKK